MISFDFKVMRCSVNPFVYPDGPAIGRDSLNFWVYSGLTLHVRFRLSVFREQS